MKNLKKNEIIFSSFMKKGVIIWKKRFFFRANAKSTLFEFVCLVLESRIWEQESLNRNGWMTLKLGPTELDSHQHLKNEALDRKKFSLLTGFSNVEMGGMIMIEIITKFKKINWNAMKYFWTPFSTLHSMNYSMEYWNTYSFKSVFFN